MEHTANPQLGAAVHVCNPRAVEAGAGGRGRRQGQLPGQPDGTKELPIQLKEWQGTREW